MQFQEDIDFLKEEGKLELDHALEHLQRELLHVRAGRASASMVDGVMVDYYGTSTPLNQVANIATSDSRTISIQPWEKSMIPVIEKAIFEANLGFTPQNNGESIMINIPMLTEERRKQLVKQVKSLGEDAKISLRSTRKKMMDGIQKYVKDGYPEDEGKRREKEVEDMIKDYIQKVDDMVAKKDEEIMTV
jgi:ribosome recycling factor